MTTLSDALPDLRAAEEVPAVAPPGWEAMAALCAAVSADLEALTHRCVVAIRGEIPDYAREDVPTADLAASVRRNLAMMLHGIAENRGPTAAELAVRAQLGHRRALQGLPVDALLQAYHVGYRELWQRLVDEAAGGGADTTELLLRAATTVWAWIHQVTEAVAAAYRETTQSRFIETAGARQRFVESICFGDPGADEVLTLARSFGFDPAGEFQAVCAPATGTGIDAVASLQTALERNGFTVVVAVRTATWVVLAQRAAGLVDAVEAQVGAPVGVGHPRAGLRGARESIADADGALLLAHGRGRSCAFGDAWWLVTVATARERLRPLVEPATRVAEAQPQLADTVRAFARERFSLTGAARLQSLHINSVIYRLDRWRALTGLDPRTFDGLVASMVALELSQSDTWPATDSLS